MINSGTVGDTVEDTVECNSKMKGCEPEPFEVTEQEPFENKNSNIYKHALKELEFLNIPEEDGSAGPDQWVRDNILELIEVFSTQGHSGFSAPYVVSLFSKLATYEVLSELTGEDSEWNDVSEYFDGVTTYQNNRCSNVFKSEDGCFQTDAVVYEDPLYPGTFMITDKSSREIKSFPYSCTSIKVKATWLQKKMAIISHLFEMYFK